MGWDTGLGGAVGWGVGLGWGGRWFNYLGGLGDAHKVVPSLQIMEYLIDRQAFHLSVNKSYLYYAT